MQVTHGSITLDNVSWTPLKAPADCRRVRFLNITPVAMKVRTNVSDANTEISVESLLEYAKEVLPNMMIRPADTIAFAQLVSGTAAIRTMADL